jgi:Putative beta-barrel porin 2
MGRSRRPVLTGACLMGLLVAGGPAVPGADFEFKGRLAVAGVQDDNLFYTSQNMQSDVITRVTPEIEAGSRSERFSLTGRFSQDAERFAEHSELDTNQARQFAAIDLESGLSRPVSFALHGDYLSTLSPGDLNLETGLAGGRARARRLAVSPSFKCKWSAATSSRIAGTLSKDDLVGGVATDTRSATFDLEHHASRRDTVSAGYSVSRYDFEGSVPVVSHLLTLGWDRRLGTRSGIALRAGPRYSEGRVDPEGSLALHVGANRTQTSLTVSRSMTTVVGLAGTVVSDSVLAGLSYDPSPSFRISATPGFYRTRDPLGGPETRVFTAGLEADWRLSDWLSVVTTYRRNVQQGGLTPGAPGVGAVVPEVARNTLYVGLVAGRSETKATAGRESSARQTP